MTNKHKEQYKGQNKQQLLLAAFIASRQYFIDITQGLELEDFSLQAAEFTSPAKWHLAHTTWFYETFILKVFVKDYVAVDKHYEVLFNSYYNGIGEQYTRDESRFVIPANTQ